MLLTSLVGLIHGVELTAYKIVMKKEILMHNGICELICGCFREEHRKTSFEKKTVFSALASKLNMGLINKG